MVTQTVSRLSRTADQAKPDSPGFVTRLVMGVLRGIARVICGLHGHVSLLHFEPTRLSLQCALCGYESEGWNVGRGQALRVCESHAPRRRLEKRGPTALQPFNERLAS